MITDASYLGSPYFTAEEVSQLQSTITTTATKHCKT
jgi:hypothetical protein